MKKLIISLVAIAIAVVAFAEHRTIGLPYLGENLTADALSFYLPAVVVFLTSVIVFIRLGAKAMLCSLAAGCLAVALSFFCSHAVVFGTQIIDMLGDIEFLIIVFLMVVYVFVVPFISLIFYFYCISDIVNRF